MIKVFLLSGFLMAMWVAIGSAMQNQEKLKQKSVELENFKFDMVTSGKACYYKGELRFNKQIDKGSFLCKD